MSALIFFSAILISYVAYSLIRSLCIPTKFPPGPKFILPWIGNALQFRKEARAFGGQHKLFDAWSQRYKSNIIGFKLGHEWFVVVLGYELVREVHLKEVFEGRPDNFFLRLRTMGTRQGITITDGKLWYQHRQFAMKQMRQVGFGRSEMEKHIEFEANALINFISSFDDTISIWPGSFLAQSVLNVLWCLIAGKRMAYDDAKLLKLLDLLDRRSKVFDICGGLLSQFPWLRFIAPDKTGYNLIRQFNMELHSLLQQTILEHKARLKQDDHIESDFIYAYLREMPEDNGNKNDKHSTFNETQLIMTILDFFIAGSQTTSNTINLGLMVLAMRADVQNTLYNEIKANLALVSGQEFPHLSNRMDCAYVDAFIMELQRFFHITPITGPRRALSDTTLGGYNVPKNTTVLISLRSVHLDEKHWVDPYEFRPERFIDSEGKAFKDEYFMPFGLGRRRCLGDGLARACTFSFIVKIVQNFHIALDEAENKPSLELQPGITLCPKPYKVKFVKRV